MLCQFAIQNEFLQYDIRQLNMNNGHYRDVTFYAVMLDFLVIIILILLLLYILSSHHYSNSDSVTLINFHISR